MSLVRGGGLSPEDAEKLDKWTYTEEDNRMSTDASVRSGLNSFELGEMHTTHSGGENVFDQNNVSKINWFPVWQGVKPLTTIGEHLGFNPTARQYTPTFTLNPNGASATGNNVSYTATVTLLDNESVLRLTVAAGEAYTGEISYIIKDANASGIVKYQQFKNVDVAIGDLIQLDFTHPAESRKGDSIYVDFMKEDETPFLVKSGSDTNAPWLSLVLANYQDIDLVSATRFITESFTVYYAGDYEVDTSINNGVTITVEADWFNTFYVSDANQTFNPTSACTVDFSAFGQGLAVLQSSKDAYKFYYDSANSVWRYKNIDTKDGGVV